MQHASLCLPVGRPAQAGDRVEKVQKDLSGVSSKAERACSAPVAVQREFYRHKLLYKYPSRSTNRGAWSAFKSRLTPRKASRPSQISGKCRRKTTQQLHIPTCMYPLPTPRQSWTHSLPTPTTAVCVLHAVVVEWLLTLSGDDDGSESRTRRISHLRCEQSSKHTPN